MSEMVHLLEPVLNLGDPLPDGLDEVVVACDLGRDHGESMPFVSLEDAEHGSGLVLKRGCQLKLKARLGGSLPTTYMIVQSVTSKCIL